MAYATGADLTSRYDIDLIGDLCQDSRESLDAGSVATHPNVLAALEDAAGEIDVALISQGRYTPTQLAALTGPSQSHLKRLNCDRAMVLLSQRRMNGVNRDMFEKLEEKTEKQLRQIADGVNVFGIPENVAAGTAKVAFATVLQLENRNLLPERMHPFFPTVSQRQRRS